MRGIRRNASGTGAGVGEEGFGWCPLDESAAGIARHVIAVSSGTLRSWVMRITDMPRSRRRPSSIKAAFLYRHVDGSRGFVGDQQRRLAGKRLFAISHSLAQAAREFVRY